MFMRVMMSKRAACIPDDVEDSEHESEEKRWAGEVGAGRQRVSEFERRTLFPYVSAALGSYHRSSYFTVNVHDAHLARRTPSLSSSAAEREEDQRLLLNRCRRAHPCQGCVRSFFITTRPPPVCPRVTGRFVLSFPSKNRS